MKSKIMSVIRFILVIIILACLAILGKRLLDYKTNADNNKYIENMYQKVENEVGEDKSTNSSEPEDEFAKKERVMMATIDALIADSGNTDIVGFLEIPDVGIAYPLLQGPDNDFYLRKGINKEYDIAGSLFLDMYNSPDFNDDNTVIYGHHLEIDSMFTPLDQYRKQDFAEKHTKVYLATKEGLREYQIFSAFGIPADYDYRTLNFQYPGDKIPYFNKLRSKSEVSLPSKNFTEDDQIITLSTCQYDYADQRLAVHAVRVR